MIRRDLAQWLEMIRRTRPTAFAVQALEREFAMRAGSDDLSDADILEIRTALEHLAQTVHEAGANAPVKASGERPQVTIEYRAHGAGGKGRLYLEVIGREQLEPFESTSADAAALDAFRVYLFSDAQAFAGIQVDDANTLPERLEPVLAALRACENELDLPRLDCPEANLENAGITDVLEWASLHRVEAGR